MLTFRVLLTPKKINFCSIMPLTNLNSRTLKNGDPEPPAPAPGTFRIYNMRFCPWAQRTLIYAAAKNIPAEIVNIQLQQKPDWYFSKHYKGQVPALEHDGRHVIESAVIPEYLDDILPENRILPTDAYEKVQQKLLLERLSSSIAPAFYGIPAFVKDPSLKEEKIAALTKAFDDAEKLLANDFFSGSSPGYVDYLIFPNIQRVYWAAHIVPDLPLSAESFPGTDKYPKLSAWFARASALPAVVEGSQPKEFGIGFFTNYFQGKPDYDYGL